MEGRNVPREGITSHITHHTWTMWHGMVAGGACAPSVPMLARGTAPAWSAEHFEMIQRAAEGVGGSSCRASTAHSRAAGHAGAAAICACP